MQYPYDIFISYRHTEKDRAWAKWLLESLETYKVPKALQQKGFPARIGKAFRDEDELPTSSDLSTNIQQALEGSKFLVVICSKDTPSSLWVDKEVATFRKLGKGDHIIPLLVEGTPETSFPASLLSLKKPIKQLDGTITESNEPLEPIAADVRPRTDEKLSTLKHLALLRILSAILGCAFDDLRQRDQQRQARKKRIQYTVAAALALIIVGVSLYLWDYNRVKVAYYNTIVYRWGVPEGVGRLDGKMHRHRQITYLFENKRGKVIRVASINSLGKLATIDEKPEGECEWIITYQTDGMIDKEITRNRFNNELLTRKYTFAIPAKGKRPKTAIVEMITPQMTPQHQVGLPGTSIYVSSIARHSIEFNDAGYPMIVRYQNVYGTPKQDMTGSYGKMSEFNSLGQAVKQADIDAAGEPKQTNPGYLWVANAYDQVGNVTEESYLDMNMEPGISPNGYSKVTNTYDKYGNVIQTCHYDQTGGAALNLVGVHKYINEYDGNGFQVERSCYGANGLRTLHRDGMSIVKTKYDKGFIEERCFYDVDGKPCIRKGIGHSISFKHDNNGDRVEISYFDQSGNPYVSREGSTRWTYKYNAKHQCVETSSFDANGGLVNTLLGISTIKNKLDNMGRLKEVIFLGEDGKQCNNIMGYSKNTMVYDERGRVTEVTVYDDKGTFIMREQANYNEMGCLLDESVLNEAGDLMVGIMGYAKTQAVYQENGNISEYRFLGLKGEPVNSSFGFASVVYKYDKNGNRTGIIGRDKSGKEVHIDSQVIFLFNNL